MHRGVVIGVVASVVAFAAAAAAGSPFATLSVSPNKAGKGSKATLDIRPPRAGQNPRSMALRVVKGVKFDPRAVAVKCTKQQANSNKCPGGSRIGGGTSDATVSSTSNPPLFAPMEVSVQVGLFLAPSQKSGDKAGVVAHFKVTQTGQQGHVIGRVRAIDVGPYGLQTSFDNLDTVLKPPAGTKAHVDHVHLTYGVHRTVKKNGKNLRSELIKNPKQCGGSWPYQLTLGYRMSGPVIHKGSIACTQ